MKKIAYLLVILGTLLPSCEKKPESFELSKIPGEYDSYANVIIYNDGVWGSNSTIPQSYYYTHEGFPCEISPLDQDHYSISFDITDPSLQHDLELEITKITEISGSFRAYVKVVENDYFKDTLLDSSLPLEVNFFKHDNHSSTVHFNIILKSKIQDDLILDLRGSKY